MTFHVLKDGVRLLRQYLPTILCRKYRLKENLAFFEDSKTQTPINQAKRVKGKRIFPLFLHQHPPTALGCALENLSFSQAEYGRCDAPTRTSMNGLKRFASVHESDVRY